EAAHLSDRVAIMDHGHLLALDTPEALTKNLPGSATLELSLAAYDRAVLEEALGALAILDGVERVEPVGEANRGGELEGTERRARLYLTGDAAAMVPPVARLLGERSVGLTDLRIGTPSLEDVFINLTGRALR
ncbi:MAG: transporter related protein, partial [Acidimicrobiaceae bacterium]|nr:transporter related protein [Acidimicrobiaceae bacterium]